MPKLFFSHVAPTPADPILGLTLAFLAEKDLRKVNLGVGLYRDTHLQTPILKSVKEAEAALIEEEKTKEYLPIDGDQVFLSQVAALIFGADLVGKVWSIQTVGGTGALRIGGEFLKQEVGNKIAISDPTWPNHLGVFTRCGMHVQHYTYYDFEKNALDFEGCLKALRNLSPGTCVLFHACCHNPTGADLSLIQWKQISDLCHEKELLPFFDFAYQGLGVSTDADAAAVRLFAQEGHEMLVASSQSKNFGLYSERVGALFVVTKSSHVLSKLKTFMRTNVSTPPAHGAKIVARILSDPELCDTWEKELTEMRQRIISLRQDFAAQLVKASKKRDFRFLQVSNGMFCYLGLKADAVARLTQEYKIYLPQDGRINLTGLNEANISYVVNAVIQVSQ